MEHQCDYGYREEFMELLLPMPSAVQQAPLSFAKIFPLPDLQMLPIGCDSACINPIADTIHGPARNGVMTGRLTVFP